MGIIKNIFAVFLALVVFTGTPASAQELNLIHIAKKRETLYGISKHYSIELTQLISQNPFLQERGLQEGDTLQISLALPEGKPKAQSQVGSNSSAVVEVAQEDYAQGQDQNTAERSATGTHGEIDSNLPLEDRATPQYTAHPHRHKHDSGAFNMALILPLFEQHHDTLFHGENPEWPAQVDRKSWAGLEFLTAFEFGLNTITASDEITSDSPDLVPERLDSADSGTQDRGRRRFWELRDDAAEMVHQDSKDSIRPVEPPIASANKHSVLQKRVDLSVIDGGRDTSLIRNMASSGMLSGFDVVVGPLYTDCIESLAGEKTWIDQREGLWVNPLSSNHALDSIPGLSHFIPRSSVLDELMLYYIDVMAQSGRSLSVFYDVDSVSGSASIQRRLAQYEHVNWIPIKSETYLASLEAYKTGEKHLVIWSENRPFTTDLITKLNALRSETLYIYGKSALADMGVQVVYLNNLHATYPVRSYLDTAAADHWTPIYAEKTGMPLTPLAMHAIDLARTLIDAASNPLFYPRQWVCRDNEVCENRAGIIVQLTEYTEIPVHLHPRTTLPKARAITPLD